MARAGKKRTIILTGFVSGLEYRAVKVSGAQLLARMRAARLSRLRYRRKAILLVLLIALFFVIQFVFPGNPALASWYSSYIFRPFQSVRNVLLGAIPFSVGDALYLMAGFAVLAVLIRWSYLLIRVRTHYHELAHSFINSILTLGLVYVFFFIGWGGNYYQPTLSSYWRLPEEKQSPEAAIVALDSFLIEKLNRLAPDFQSLTFKETNRRGRDYFRLLTDTRTELRGLKAKASLYGYFMQYLGIQGYYNPFTGEAQVNSMLPKFMLPFVLCHELAHQNGIAAEDDANLLSYAICTAAPDPAFSYSGYFNLWLYAHARLKSLDSAKAHSFYDELNPLSRHQIDTLRAIRRRYTSPLSDYSGELYDRYLRLHHQKEGIASYDKVSLTAWRLEQERAERVVKLRLP